MRSFPNWLALKVLALFTVLMAATGCLSDVPDPYCGDGTCNGGESSYSCSIDCGSPRRCGDGVCNSGETRYTCSIDCASTPTGYCGDGICDASLGESSSNCTADCGVGPVTRCGDGTCNGNETSASCPQDCSTTPKDCGPDHLPIATNGVRLQVNGLPQQCSEWCWAAVSTMLANYYGIGASECELASIRNGFGQNGCCIDQACLYAQCNTPAPPPVIESMLANVLGIHGIALNSELSGTAAKMKLTEREVQVELSNGRPFVVGYVNSFAGHVVLVDGFGPGAGGYLYSVEDPFYGHFDVSYNQLAYGYMGGGQPWTWAYTAYRLSPRSDGCNVNFDPGCVCN